MIKTIIIDDQIILRESLKFILEQDKEIEVVACGGNGKEALEFCDTLSPDLVIMDLSMPICDGVEGTKLIKSRNKSIKVLILTTFDDNKNVSEALKNGADGYVLKDIKPDELVMAVKGVAKGLSIIHRNALDAVVEKLADVKDNKEFNLTDREKTIIGLIVDGKSNKEIAISISFAEGSVKNIITGILNKLNLKDRTQLAIFAVKNDLI